MTSQPDENDVVVDDDKENTTIQAEDEHYHDAQTTAVVDEVTETVEKKPNPKPAPKPKNTAAKKPPPPRYGQGKGKSNSNLRRHKNKSKVLRGIPRPAIRRLARRGGVKRISATIYDIVQEEIGLCLESLVYNAMVRTEHARRKTVVLDDVLQSFRFHGINLYGCV